MESASLGDYQIYSRDKDWNEDHPERILIIEPSLPYLYVPDDDLYQVTQVVYAKFKEDDEVKCHNN